MTSGVLLVSGVIGVALRPGPGLAKVGGKSRELPCLFFNKLKDESGVWNLIGGSAAGQVCSEFEFVTRPG
jgi:hypothetical protein